MYSHQRDRLRYDPNDLEYDTNCCREEREKKMQYEFNEFGSVIEEWEVSQDDDEANQGTLPLDVLEAAGNGNVEEINDYLSKDLPVNAHYRGEDLLYRACAQGQVEVVQLLMKCPDIHVNRMFQKETPLNIAARLEHLDCVLALLRTTGKCRPYLHSGWKSIVKVFGQQPHLSQSAILYILTWAGYKEQWQAALVILQTELYIPENYMSHLATQAMSHNEWVVVKDILRRNFSGREKVINEAFGVAIRLRLLTTAQEILTMMDPKLKIEESLVELALAGDDVEVRRLLEEVYNSEVTILNTCLLVIAAGGTTQTTADVVMHNQEIFSHETLANALFLSYLGKQSEVFVQLLGMARSSFSFHDLYSARLATSSSFLRPSADPCDKLLDQIIEEKAKAWCT